MSLSSTDQCAGDNLDAASPHAQAAEQAGTTASRAAASTPAPKARGAAVWAIAFACAISYMGIGLVDPILPTISRDLHATPGETELLFSTYLFVTAVVMFFSSWVSSKIGHRSTLIVGLGLVVCFAVACALSPNVAWVIGFRGGWGVGNALFVSTALAAIIGATAGSGEGIVLYEAALGVGMAVGPLVGGVLGDISWRGPFAGTACLMAIALIGIAVVLPRTREVSAPRSIKAPFRALAHVDFRLFLAGAFVYNFAYFIMLAYSPFPIQHAAQVSGLNFTPMHLGFVFFGWGGLLALCSVVVAPRISRRLGVRTALTASLGSMLILLVILAFFPGSLPVQLIGTIVGGGLAGSTNTIMTQAAMEATPL